MVECILVEHEHNTQYIDGCPLKNTRHHVTFKGSEMGVYRISNVYYDECTETVTDRYEPLDPHLLGTSFYDNRHQLTAPWTMTVCSSCGLYAICWLTGDKKRYAELPEAATQTIHLTSHYFVCLESVRANKIKSANKV
jgi:hypothetical protein